MNKRACARTAAAGVGVLALLLPVVSSADVVAAEHRASARKTKITAQPSQSSVLVDTAVSVSGRVSGPKKRKVTLEIQATTGWRLLAKTRSKRDGSFVFDAPTYWYGHHVLRVRAPAVKKKSHRFPAGRSKPFAVDVGYEYTPVGDPHDYQLLFADSRWDPCKVIGWRYNPTGGFPGSDAVLARAIAQLTRATGLRFQYEGTTTKVPFVDNVEGEADLVVGWSTADVAPQLAGSQAGYGEVQGASRSSAKLEYYLGMVVLDSQETSYQPSYDPTTPGAKTWGQVMLHELGHTVGLLHAASPDQMMYPLITAPSWGQGDLAGLQRVGADGGCWDQGAP